MRTIAIGLFFILISYSAMTQKDYSRQWAKVDSLENLGQNRTSLEVVMQIFESSKQNNVPDQTIKALIYKAKLESDFKEDSFQEALAFTKSELENSSGPVKQVLYSIMAQLYWDYYISSSWQIDGRTPLIDQNSEDIKTWDTRKFIDVCTNYFLLSLSNENEIKNTALSNFESILESKKNTRYLRPTLYDFLAHRAIGFFTQAHTGTSISAKAFKLNSADYFASAADFVKLLLPSEGVLSFDFHALKIYQEIIDFHIGDRKDYAALIDADLARLEFVYQKSTLSTKEILYKKALRDLRENYKDHPMVAAVSYKLALLLDQSGAKYNPLVSADFKWDKKEALAVAENAIEKFPDSEGATNCRNLIEQIKAPSLQITSNYAVVPLKPSLALVKYKNISKLYFRLLKLDPEKDQKLNMKSQDEIVAYYLGLQSVQSWNTPLPSDGDFQSHSTEVIIPSIPSGYYILLASSDESFSAKSQMAYSRFWSTSLSIINKHNSNGENEVFVLGRFGGQPLSNVKVQSFTREYDYKSREYKEVEGKTYFSDKLGYVRILPEAANKNSQFYLVLTSKKDKFITEPYFSNYRFDNNQPRTELRTHLFTDRAIYRPGQTIYYKGIVVEMSGDKSKLKTNFQAKVDFYDVNGQLVASQQVVTNEFGSYTGTFVAPAGALTGQMSISSSNGSVSVQVEEYKRPKFEISFLPVTGAYKLDENITITGKATSYAGSAISDAGVRYRVVRNVRFPYFWWGWRGMYPTSPEMEIANGELTTNSKGEFSITFNAMSDPAVTNRYSPVFTYSVFADVSDINGETHSSETSVSVGYDALLVSTSLADEINGDNAIRFEIKTTNLNGESEKAQGIVAVHKLITPSSVMFSRKWERPDLFVISQKEFFTLFPNEIYSNEDDISTWAREAVVMSKSFSTPSDSVIVVPSKLEPGMYVAEIKTNDAFGKEILYTKYFRIYATNSKIEPSATPLNFTLLTPEVQPGQTVSFLISTPLKKANVMVEVVSKNMKPKTAFYNLNNEQIKISIPVAEENRGNMRVNIVCVKNNRVLYRSEGIEVPFTNKELDITLSSFRSKLEPGAKEEWQISIKDKQKEKVFAEMLAGMYDASLDAFVAHNWYFNVLPYFGTEPIWNSDASFRTVNSTIRWVPQTFTALTVKEYEQLLWFGFNNYYRYRGYTDALYTKSAGIRVERSLANDMPVAPTVEEKSNDEIVIDDKMVGNSTPGLPPAPPLSAKPRKDFNETAFFFPQLITNSEGETSIRFTMPESLTRWRMMGIAHTKDLKVGKIEKTLLTQKDLMVFPNAPRFLREGDRMHFSVKVSNVSDTDLDGRVTLQFFDALTMRPLDAEMGNVNYTQSFQVAKQDNTVADWVVSVPEGLQAVVYRVIATSGSFSDGEESALPVLTNRMLVTESLPLPVRGNSTKTFTFDKLLASKNAGSSLRNYKLTLEYTSNPAWYAVQALPYLMEYPYECAEQLYSRYYANTLATHIAHSNEKIKRVFEAWKNISPDALKSNLQKNEELKNILLQESPWVREANNESERKQRIALLFDLNRMSLEQKSAIKKLKDMQSINGGWPWFPGMPESEYITQHIVTGLGHLYYLEAISMESNPDIFEMLGKAIGFLDAEKLKSFEKLKKSNPDYANNNQLGYNEIQYFYARTYFLADFPLAKELDEMVNFYKSQATKYWKLNNNYARAMTALFLNRFGDTKTSSLIMRSLTETALYNDEMGMYWKNNNPGWNWYEAPVETQAMMIEAYDEVLNDTKSVDELNVWLLKQKQTQDWKTTKATTEAIYALLLRGESLLASDKQVEVKVGNQQVNPYLANAVKPEPGTGYFKTSWGAESISAEMGKVEVINPNNTVAWGSLYWQYFEQLDKITPAATPLKLSKQLFVEKYTDKGPVLEAISADKPIKVGDKIVVRVTLSADRSMEYIHLKDMRASAFEPVNVLSGYRWQDGLGYYEATGDAATNFFIHYLPKGTYVFEYKLNATQKGDFSNGITSVQCMYAPEFSAHSEGIRVVVE